MGYVFKDSHTGHWYCAYRDEDGKLCRRATGAPTKSLARRILEKHERDVVEKKWVGAKTYPDISFRQFAARFLRHSRATNGQSTSHRDRTIVDNLLDTFGDRMLRLIKRRDIQDYLDRRASTVYHRKNGTDKRIAPQTVDRERIGLMAMFSYAINQEYLPETEHPVRKVKIPKGETKKQRELTPDEEGRLLTECRKPENPRLAYLESIILTALGTGMREGELLSLKWRNVDLTERRFVDGSRSHGRITVESTNDNPNKDRETRSVPVTKDLRVVLTVLHELAIKKAEEEKKIEVEASEIHEHYVFTNPRTGTRWVDTKLAWYSALRKAKITGFRFHDLRHTFATRARRSGMPLEVLQLILGHSDVTTTMRYAHVGAWEADKYVNRMNQQPEGFELRKAVEG